MRLAHRRRAVDQGLLGIAISHGARFAWSGDGKSFRRWIDDLLSNEGVEATPRARLKGVLRRAVKAARKHKRGNHGR